MIVRSLDDVRASERNVAWGNGLSRRFLLAQDGMGYSLTDTIVEAGTSSLLEYRNHLETCYCIEGEGEVVNAITGEKHIIRPGTMYALDRNEPHVLSASKQLRLVCVFSPALQGPERHNLGAQSSVY